MPGQSKLYLYTHAHAPTYTVLSHCNKLHEVQPQREILSQKGSRQPKGLFGGCEGLSDVMVFGVLREKENPQVRLISDSEVREVRM